MTQYIIRNKTLEKCLLNKPVIDLSLYTEIKYISENAFEKCTEVSKIIFPKSVRKINDMTFSNCRSLESVDIPSSAKIEGNPFLNTPLYKKTMRSKGYFIINHTLINKATDDIDPSEFNMLRRINWSAYNSDQKLRELNLSQAVDLEYIEPYSFYQCSSLSAVVFSSECPLKTIGKQTFAFCGNLYHVDLPASIEDINKQAFAKTKWLEKQMDRNGNLIYNNILISKNAILQREYVLPDTIKYIGSEALSREPFKKVYLNEGLKKIFNNGFAYCSSLEEIYFPDSIKYIGIGAFEGCHNLKLENISLSFDVILDNNSFDF